MAPAICPEGIRVGGPDSSHVLPWPRPADVHQLDDHLLCAITADAADDFLDAIGWPLSCERDSAPEALNGPLVRGREMGYDLADHVKRFSVVMGYQLFSVVEILAAAGYPGIPAFPLFFLSHVQAEGWTVTRRGMLVGARRSVPFTRQLRLFFQPWLELRRCPVWVDYFCLRQKQRDFQEEAIKRVIANIAHTVVLCKPLRGRLAVEATRRLWCIFEILNTVKAKVAFTAVELSWVYFLGIPFLLPFMCIWDWGCCFMGHMKVENAEARDADDKRRILADLEENGGGARAVNKEIHRVITWGPLYWLYCSLAGLAVLGWFVLGRTHGGVTFSDIILFPLVLAMCVAMLWLSRGPDLMKQRLSQMRMRAEGTASSRMPDDLGPSAGSRYAGPALRRRQPGVSDAPRDLGLL